VRQLVADAVTLQPLGKRDLATLGGSSLLHHFSKYLKSWVTVCNKTLLNLQLLKTRTSISRPPRHAPTHPAQLNRGLCEVALTGGASCQLRPRDLA
jgi:hypothetical protein